MMSSKQLIWDNQEKKLISQYDRNHSNNITHLIYNRKKLEKIFGKLTLQHNPLGFFYGEINSKDKYWYEDSWGVYCPHVKDKKDDIIKKKITTLLMTINIVKPDDGTHKIKNNLKNKTKKYIRQKISKLAQKINKLADLI